MIERLTLVLGAITRLVMAVVLGPVRHDFGDEF